MRLLLLQDVVRVPGQSLKEPPTRRRYAIVAKLKFMACAASFVVFMVGVAPANAETASDARRQRDAVQRKRAEVAARLNALEASDRDLEAAVAALDREVARTQARVAAAEQAARAAESAAAQAGVRLAATEAELVDLRDTVTNQAVQAYMQPNGPSTRSLIGASDPNEAARLQAFLQVVAGDTSDTIDRLLATQQDLAVQRQAADEARQVAVDRRDAIRGELAEVATARANQARLRDALDRRIASFRTEADALSREEAQLGALIRARQVPTRASRSDSVASDSSRVSGAGLIWPVRGPVTSEYGPRWGRMHEGIDISAPTGTPIRAAKAGEVIFVGQQGGYGNMTIIDHGGGFITAYPHQSRFGTREGASVAQGEVIGYVGCSGSCTGPHLHFETRVNGSAQDPRRYLP